MDGAENRGPISSHSERIQGSDAPQTAKPETETSNYKPFADAEKFSLAIERFSGLSSELITLLMGLSQEINKSAEEFKAVRAAVDLNRKELDELRKTETSATVLERQTEDLMRQKENLERLILDQRSVWEAEKIRRIREEKEYNENRKILRDREEEEYRKSWAAEEMKARQMLEEELSVIRQKDLEARETEEKEILNRELMLKKKELELGQLIRELEEILSRRVRCARPDDADPAVLPGVGPALKMPSAGPPKEEMSLLGSESDSQSDLSPEEVVMWEKTCGEKASSVDIKKVLLDRELKAEKVNLPSSSKAPRFLSGRNSEASGSVSSGRRDGAPLKSSPPKNDNNTTDV